MVIQQRLFVLIVFLILFVSTRTIVNAQTPRIDECQRAIESTPVDSLQRLDAMLKLTDALRDYQLPSALSNADKTVELANRVDTPDYLVVAQADQALIRDLLGRQNPVLPESEPLALSDDAPQNLRVHLHDARLVRVVWQDQIVGFRLQPILDSYRAVTQNCAERDLVIQQKSLELYVRLYWLGEQATDPEVVKLKDDLVLAAKNHPALDAETVVQLWNSQLAGDQGVYLREFVAANQALESAQNNKNRFYTIQCYRKLQRLYQENGHHSKALKMCDLAESVAIALESQALVTSMIRTSVKLHDQLGDQSMSIQRLLELEKSTGFAELGMPEQQHFYSSIVRHFQESSDTAMLERYRAKIVPADVIAEYRMSNPDDELFKLASSDIALNPLIDTRQLLPGNLDPQQQVQVLAARNAQDAAASIENANRTMDTAKSNASIAMANEATALKQLARYYKVAVFALSGLSILTLWIIVMFARNRLKRISTELDNEKKNVNALSLRIARLQRMESLGLMAGSVAHDFNNILVGVIGNAEILQMKNATTKDDFFKQQIKNIIRSAEKAAGLSRQMLAYAGKQPISKHVADLNELVLQFESILRSTCSVSQQLCLELCESPTISKIDFTQVEQVLLNLVTNASKASSDNGTITIRTGFETLKNIERDRSIFGTRLTGGDFCFIEVTDQGVGISHVDMERIFEPFFTSSDLGRGLGLSVVYGVVEGHHGFVRCLSTIGKGTTMRVFFPTSREPIEKRIDPVNGPSQEIALPQQPRSETILVIDDEEHVLDLCSQLLQLSGYKVISSLGGDAGIKAITEDTENKISCVLMDVMMPEMGANELLKRMEELEIKTPVVLMSGFSQIRLDFLLDRPNVSTLIQKPFRADEIQSAIDVAVQERQPLTPPAKQPSPGTISPI